MNFSKYFVFIPFFLSFSCFQGGKIDVNNLDPVLEAMEVKLTEKELNLLKDLLRGEHYRKHCDFKQMCLQD